jgi:COP9 signalosome complex subunit 7
MISIADEAQRSKDLDYDHLMRVLEMPPSSSIRELENLIIDCIYNELVQGQLDQLN